MVDIKVSILVDNVLFSVASAKLWNALQLDILSSDNLMQFERNLKAHLFRKAFYLMIYYWIVRYLVF